MIACIRINDARWRRNRVIVIIMKPRTPSLWLIAAIIGLLMPSLAFAGMTPEEVKAFEAHKERALKGDLKAHL